jgi:hypothetical protein
MNLPTAREMKDFASRFSKEEWKKLCTHKKFIEVFDVNLKACRILAEKILADKKYE